MELVLHSDSQYLDYGRSAFTSGEGVTKPWHSWKGTKVERGEADFYRRAKRGVSIQALVAPRWFKDVLGPSFVAGMAAALIGFSIAGIVSWSWDLIGLAALGCFGMAFLIVMLMQMLAYNAGHFIWRWYKVPDDPPIDNRPVFVPVEDNPRQHQRQPSNLNEPLAIMSRHWIRNGEYVGPQHLPARDGMRDIDVKMSQKKFGEFYEAMDRQGYIAGENKLVTAALHNELYRRAAATPTPPTSRPELRPA